MNIREEYDASKNKEPIQVAMPKKLRALFRYIAEVEGIIYANRWIANIVIPAAQTWVDTHSEEVMEFETWWQYEEKKKQ